MGYKKDDATLAKVGDDEPIFVLRAQDKFAASTIRYWAERAESAGAPREKIIEALDHAEVMEAWHTQKVPD